MDRWLPTPRDLHTICARMHHHIPPSGDMLATDSVDAPLVVALAEQFSGWRVRGLAPDGSGTVWPVGPGPAAAPPGPPHPGACTQAEGGRPACVDVVVWLPFTAWCRSSGRLLDAAQQMLRAGGLWFCVAPLDHEAGALELPAGVSVVEADIPLDTGVLHVWERPWGGAARPLSHG